MKRIRFEDFVEKYKPIKNPFNPDAPHNGYMFETYGEEMRQVLEARAQNSGADGAICTVMDDNTIQWGFHIVNRCGYIICTVPPPANADSFIFDGDITDTDEVISITEDELNATMDKIRRKSLGLNVVSHTVRNQALVIPLFDLMKKVYADDPNVTVQLVPADGHNPARVSIITE